MKGKWRRILIVDCGEIITGATPPTATTLYWGGKYNFYTPADFGRTKYCYKTERAVTEAGVQKGRKIPEKSILFTCIASVGKMAIAGKEGITNQQINTIVVNDKFYYNYIYYVLLFNSEQIQRMAPLTSVPIINKTEFENIQLWICNERHDQQHIADILTSCDEVIEQTEKAIEKYRAIKAGMLQDLFTRGVDANGKLRPKPEDAPELYKDSPLGKIPKEWEIKTIGQCCSEPMYGLNAPAIPFDQKHRYIRITDISDISHKYLKDDVVSPAFYSDQYLVAEGDILFARTGASVGKTYIFDPCDNPLYFAGFLIRFRVNQDYNPYYIFYQTETFVFLNWVSIMSVRTGQPGVNSTEYSTFQMPMPSEKSEQDMIAKRLSAIDTKIETEEQILAKCRSIKLGLMKKLLTPPEGALEA